MTRSANQRRRDISFAAGDLVYLSTAHLKIPAGLTRKLSPTFVGPFRVLEHVGAVSYRLALPPEFGSIHPVFHISQLKLHQGPPPP